MTMPRPSPGHVIKQVDRPLDDEAYVRRVTLAWRMAGR
jgi:hypothetical protein